jgi:hypothetical protein
MVRTGVTTSVRSKAFLQEPQHQSAVMLAPLVGDVLMPGAGDEVEFARLGAKVEKAGEVFRWRVHIVAAGEQQDGARGQVADEVRRRDGVDADAEPSFGDPDDAAAVVGEPRRIAGPDAVAKGAGQVVIQAFQDERAKQRGLVGGETQGGGAHGNAEGGGRFAGPALGDEVVDGQGVARLGPAEAGSFTAALAMAAMIEHDTSKAGAGQEGDAGQHLRPIFAQAMEQSDGAARLGLREGPAIQADAVAGSACERLARDAVQGGRPVALGRTGSRQPAGDGIGRREVADAGNGSEAGENVVDPRRGRRGLGHQNPRASRVVHLRFRYRPAPEELLSKT